MSFKRGWRILSAFFVLVLLSTILMPCVAAMPGKQASGTVSQDIISIESITLSPDRSSTEFAVSSVVGASTSTFESGAFTMTYLQANGNARKQTVTGRYSETKNKDGSSYTRITSDGMVYELSMKPVDQVEDGTLWEIEETRTIFGESVTMVDTLVIPPQNSASTVENSLIVTKSAKTKVDVPHYAPDSAILIFNDVRAKDILYGGAVVGIIAGIFCVEAGVIIGVAVLAIDIYLDSEDVDASNIYLDIYFWPEGITYNHIFTEVDYYYI